jgi:nicotinate phosphoribosyltransferase
MREGRPLLSCVMRQGKRLRAASPVMEMAFRARARLSELPGGVTSIDGAAKYPVAISPALDGLARDAVRAHS